MQNTLRVTKVFWGLDDNLANRRHFPAINWLLSYSLYIDNLKYFWSREIAEEFVKQREAALKLLAQEAELEEIVRLVGIESLSVKEQLVLFSARLIREDFLYQSAFDPIDQYSSLKKQYLMLGSILLLHRQAEKAIEIGVPLEEIKNLPAIEKIARFRLIEESRIEEDCAALEEEININMNKVRCALHHA